MAEHFFPLIRGRKWNIDEGFMNKFESLMSYSRLRDLTDCELTIRTGYYYVISNGTNCILTDTAKTTKIFEESLRSSVKDLRYASLRACNALH
ncbi:hypothetical protein MUP77_05835 [Candidatus Bathyarchaeota archaeon]|nr:hypothetical protein [Candidatus Bathyarchaeota archaeon]